jgi:hypothetical protein
VAALRDGGRLVIMDGTYAEGLDVRGLKADVRVQGNVVLARPRPAPAPGGGLPRAEGGDPAPTGTVARAASPGIF